MMVKHQGLYTHDKTMCDGETLSFVHTLLASTAEFYRGADKFLALPGRKQARATEDFYFHVSYLLPQLEEY